MKTHVSTSVNGQVHEVLVEPQQSLLEALRDEMGLTGTKEGCGIDIGGAASRFDHRGDVIEDLGRQFPGRVHAGEIGGLINPNAVAREASAFSVQGSDPVFQAFDATNKAG